MFSKSCEYGIKAVIYITQQSIKNNRVKLNDIAEAIDSPAAFTAKTLQLLSKAQIIRSVMGQLGGYEIDLDRCDSLTLYDIVHLIDGEKLFSGCGLGLVDCNAKEPCPIHDQFSILRKDLKIALQKTSLKEFAVHLNSGSIHLKRPIINSLT